MKKYKSCSKLKAEAKEYLTGYYGTYILMIAILLFIAIVIRMAFSILFVMLDFVGLFGNGFALFNILEFITVFISTIVINMFSPGILLFCMKRICGGTPLTIDVFYGFQENFIKTLAISTIIALPQMICIEPAVLLEEMYYNTSYTPYLLSAIAYFVIGICVYIPLEIILSMTFFVMIDFPQYSARETVEMAIKLTKGHRLRILYMQFSFIPVSILAMLSCGIGMLWVMPYMNMTYCNFYLNLMKPEALD